MWQTGPTLLASADLPTPPPSAFTPSAVTIACARSTRGCVLRRVSHISPRAIAQPFFRPSAADPDPDPRPREPSSPRFCAGGETDMGEDGKYLETARADRSVWLMKCPPVVSRAWNAASASSSDGGASPNPVVAKVVLSLDLLSSEEPSLQARPRIPASRWSLSSVLRIWSADHTDRRDSQVAVVSFKMELAQTNTGNTPKSYSLNMFQDFVPMGVFSESNQGKLSCEGKVEHKFDMEPHSDNLVNYGKLCRERTQKSMVKARQVQVLDKDHGMSMRPMPGMVGLMPSGSKEKKRPAPTKPSDVKRTRRDRTEMENIIFKLFEKQPNWALKALVQETDQPEQFLKEILNDLCVYNKRGPNQGTHELKPEYKKSTGDTDGA
ncbi:hypothetical protein PR202_ga05600 [Eleusine coracana subsp. coracana]|uniref:TFIIF beta subunit HTH domain-containing protein n=1 Tax=Eleusine coracana subsp. coracana TaxID=191504 RepID=A0AAV5BU22_ELECO|nr:hypothetical protein PR202_ga05146 [Eleusine coracana subsp. coracana]GJM89408.1 hypothetical protein PR202_ga05600 [Eleusine coracana subsp. coracana]